MNSYVLVTRNRRGAMTQRFEFAAPDDAEAKRIAETEARGRDAELWCGARRVATLAASAQLERLEAIRSRVQDPLPAPQGAAVIATTPVGMVAYWDQNAAALYGWRPKEAVGRNIIELTPAVQSRVTAADIMATLQAGRGWAGEIVLRRKGGAPFRAFVLDVPVGDLEGDEAAIVGVSLPIDRAEEILTRQAEIEDELARRFRGDL